MPMPLDLGLPAYIGHNYKKNVYNSTYTIIAVNLWQSGKIGKKWIYYSAKVTFRCISHIILLEQAVYAKLLFTAMSASQ